MDNSDSYYGKNAPSGIHDSVSVGTVLPVTQSADVTVGTVLPVTQSADVSQRTIPAVMVCDLYA